MEAQRWEGLLYGPYTSPLMEHVGSIFSIRFVTAMQILLHQFNHSLSLVLAPSCPENTALTPPTAASYPNPPTNSPMLQWTSIDSWICTALHCLPSSGFPPRTEPSFFGKVVLHQSPNLFSLSLYAPLLFLLPSLLHSFFSSPLARLFSLCHRALQVFTDALALRLIVCRTGWSAKGGVEGWCCGCWINKDMHVVQ